MDAATVSPAKAEERAGVVVRQLLQLRVKEFSRDSARPTQPCVMFARLLCNLDLCGQQVKQATCSGFDLGPLEQVQCQANREIHEPNRERLIYQRLGLASVEISAVTIMTDPGVAVLRLSIANGAVDIAECNLLCSTTLGMLESNIDCIGDVGVFRVLPQSPSTLSVGKCVMPNACEIALGLKHNVPILTEDS
eukprot:3214404-Amphidinium_carterae.3